MLPAPFPGDNQTIDSQAAGMKAWCAENEWPIDWMFIDEAMEGSREDREQFQLMMSLATQEPRPVDGIVLWAFSRFAQRVFHGIRLTPPAKNGRLYQVVVDGANAEVVFTEPIDSPFGDAVMPMFLPQRISPHSKLTSSK